MLPAHQNAKEVTLSKVLAQAKSGQVKSIALDDADNQLTVTLKSGATETSGYPIGYGTHLIDTFSPKITFTATPNLPQSLASAMVARLLPIAFLVGCMFLLLRFALPGGRARTKGPLEAGQIPPTRFTDVAGLDEVVEEMTEVVQFLHKPDMFTAIGARMPHGFLLVGPPGTGKTLLARAIAGESGVPFFALSGSDFLDTYVGVGASKVRRVFDQARKAKKAIIFIDELDAVGRNRSSGMQNAATDESDRTLNALLVEMDGFVTSQVIVLAATNRPEVLDSALLRPGRFDRKITFTLPDRAGRQKILDLATAPIKMDATVNLEAVSKRTSSLTGADLYFLANEAALTAGRESATEVAQSHFEKAIEVTFLGRARTSLFVSDEERKITAWHEGAHAVVAHVVEAANNPVSASIIPRGEAGGATWMETDDRHFISKSHANAELAVAMAGRAGEMVLVGDDFTSGAVGDIRAAAGLARNMVTKWGMGPTGLFFSDELGTDRDLDVTKAVNDLLGAALTRAQEVLAANEQLHTALANELLADDTVSGERISELAVQYPPSAKAS